MNPLSKQVIKTLFYVGLTGLLLYGLWLVRFTLIYLLISAVIALIGKPVVDRLSAERWPWIRLNRSLAALVTLLLIMAVFTGIMSIFIPALMTELKVMSQIDFEGLYQEVQDEVLQMQAIFMNSEPEISSKDSLLRPGLREVFNLENISNTFTGLIGSMGNLVFALFSILFITFFFLREQYLFRNIVLALVSDEAEKKVLHVAPTLRQTLGRYFAGLIMQITIVTLLVSIGLNLMGFNNTVVIGFFAGLINVIPYLGPFIGMSFGLVLGLAQTLTVAVDLSLWVALFRIVVVFGTVQLIDNFLLQPLIFSRSIKAHPLEIFIVISFAAALGGIAGMIVAVPVYSVIRLLAVEFFPHVKFIRWLVQNKLNDAHRKD